MNCKRDWIIAGITLGLAAAVPLFLRGYEAAMAGDRPLAASLIGMGAAFLIGVPIITYVTRSR